MTPALRQTPTKVPTLELSNGRLLATITPQWGGRVWGLARATATGSTPQDMVYNNKYYQPNNDALRQAYTQGGIEWNIGNQIGHMSQTQDPIYAAKIATIACPHLSVPLTSKLRLS